MGATVPIQVEKTRCNALVDTGATRSCMSKQFYEKCMLPEMKNICQVSVVSATGGNVNPLGLVTCKVAIGNKMFQVEFVVCEKIKRPCYLGLDFLRKYKIGLGWSTSGKFELQHKNQVLIESLDTHIQGPEMKTRQDLDIQPRAIMVLNVKINIEQATKGLIYDVRPNTLLLDEYPNLIMIPLLHNVEGLKIHCVPCVVINLSHDNIFLPKGEVIGHLEPTTITMEELVTETSFTEIETPEEILKDKEIPLEKKFITSPADVERHRRVILQDAEVPDENRKQFKELCQEYDDIFSKGAGDIGKTPLITMEIDTGDSPPVCQRPYNLPLKHAEWVKKELETLEKAGIISRSISPWASPIVIVPKKTEPGEPPKKRLCVDYRVINSLIPPVAKAHSKAKGVLTLVPLPKIDEIYARLRGSTVFSALDMTSGYHHMELSEEAKPKSAFVTPVDKYQFNRCPFGLTQAPAYFQRLVNKVLIGLPFVFGYLDDVLIFSPNIEMHLKHIRQVFERLRKADLKLKKEKCNFLKAHIQYLGHLISGDGIEPVPEKLESIEKMPAPTTPKEIKQFLGLTGYYRKFVPRFADIARPLTALTKKDVEFLWTEKCQTSFEILKEALMKEPILVYPDPELPYTLFTDASKYAWAAVLTQAYNYDKESKEITINHPITFASGLFKGSQLNWAALTKEAYAIYMAVKKLNYYLEDAEVTLMSDHLPLKKFLQRNTMNTKVNNWAVEISAHRIKFRYIKGIKNTLADTMSRLIKIDPEMKLEEEEEGKEYGYAIFEGLPPILTKQEINSLMIGETTLEELQSLNQNDQLGLVTSKEQEEVETKIAPILQKQVQNEDNTQDKPEPIFLPDEEIIIPIKEEKLIKMQKRDKFCKNLLNQLQAKKLSSGNPYFLEEGILKRYIDDQKQRFEVTVLPRHLITVVLRLAHEGMGHNGIPRTYALVRRLYYWKGLKPMVKAHVKACKLCQMHNEQVVKYNKLNFKAQPAPMKFISMDLIGEFYPPSKQGNRYALTVVCMHTGYTFCIPIPDKSAATVAKAYINNVYCWFGAAHKILTDNGTEFKNALLDRVAEEIGVEHKIYSPPYHPQSNGKIEAFHYFLKACIAKHMTQLQDWDEVVPLACAAYNFLPNEYSRESPFFLMFGRDPILPLNKLIKPEVRYLGNDENILSLEALKNIYEIAATNLKYARARYGSKTPIEKHIKDGDLVLIKNNARKPFEPRYVGNFRVVSIKGQQVEVRPAIGGKSHWVHISHVKYSLPADNIITNLPDYSQFGRKTKLRLNPDKIPDLDWKLATTLNTVPTITTSHVSTVAEITTTQVFKEKLWTTRLCS